MPHVHEPSPVNPELHVPPIPQLHAVQYFPYVPLGHEVQYVPFADWPAGHVVTHVLLLET